MMCYVFNVKSLIIFLKRTKRNVKDGTFLWCLPGRVEIPSRNVYR